MDRVVGKIILLREICEHKNVLFGPFSEDITLQRKVDLWNKILEKGKSLGLFSYDKDYKYLRDIFWQNLKRTALGKKNAQSKSGREKKYSPIDDLVFEILEKSNTPVPPIPKMVETFTKREDEDSFGSTMQTTKIEEISNDDPNIVYLNASDDHDALNGVDAISSSPIPKKRARPYRKKFDNGEKMKKRKMALQVEFMELQNYKLKLEVWEMERKLGINGSAYTKDIAKSVSVDGIAESNFAFKEADSEDVGSDDDDDDD